MDLNELKLRIHEQKEIALMREQKVTTIEKPFYRGKQSGFAMVLSIIKELKKGD